MANAAGFAVSVKLVDLASGPLAKLNQSIASVEKTATRFGRNTGLLQARDALSKARSEATDFGDKLREIFQPLGALTGAASVAGLVELGRGFASAGAEIGRTSAAIGVNTDALQRLRGMARLVGVDAAAATQSLEGIAQTKFEVSRGMNTAALVSAKKHGIDLTKDAFTIMRQLSRAITTDADLINDPVKARALEKLITGTDSYFEVLRRGPAEFDRLDTKVRDHGQLTKQQIEDAGRLTESFGDLELSAISLGRAIGAHVGSWLGPVNEKMSSWLDTLQQTPGALRLVELAADALAAAIGLGLIAKLTRLVALLASPGLALLFNPVTGLLAAIAGGFALKGATENDNPDEWKKDIHKDLSGDVGKFLDELLKDLHDWWFGPSGAAPGAGGSGGTAHPGGASLNDLYNNFANMRMPSGIGWQKFDSPAAGIAAIENQLRIYRDKYGIGTLRGIVGRWSPPNENDTEALIAAAVKSTGKGADQPLDLGDPATMRAVVKALIENEHGGRIPTAAASALAEPISGSAVPAGKAAAPLGGTAAGGEAPITSPFDPRLPPLDLPKMAPPLPMVAPPVPTAATPAPGATGQQGFLDLDTKHEFVLRLEGVPPGSRGEMRQAAGPAVASVATSYAMPVV